MSGLNLAFNIAKGKLAYYATLPDAGSKIVADIHIFARLDPKMASMVGSSTRLPP